MNTTEPMAPPSGAAPTPDLIEGAAPDKTDRPGTYELMVIFPATLPDEEVPTLRTKVATALAEHGLKITGQEDFGKRKLAFPIKHVRQGFYELYRFDGPRSSIGKIDRSLRLMPEVLRHLVTVRRVRSEAQLEEEAALRERIQAKRMAAEERAVAERHAKEIAPEQTQPPKPVREVSKEELEKKLEEILTDETLGE